MTLEIAQRLMNMRRARGYSQEELARRLGISRQAVSKWERAEACPDTDNLIALAQLYGVTLDQLIHGETPAGMMDVPHTSTADHMAEELPVTMPVDDAAEDIPVTMPEPAFAEDAGPTMPVEDEPFRTGYEMDPEDPLPHGSYYETMQRQEEEAREERRRRFPYPVAVTIAYLLMGFLLGWWHPGWIIFLTIPLYYLPPQERTYMRLLGNPVMVTIVYLLLGCVLGWWHPGWLVFLLIPVMAYFRNR